jgi:hypothetical protein
MRAESAGLSLGAYEALRGHSTTFVLQPSHIEFFNITGMQASP